MCFGVRNVRCDRNNELMRVLRSGPVSHGVHKRDYLGQQLIGHIHKRGKYPIEAQHSESSHRGHLLLSCGLYRAHARVHRLLCHASNRLLPILHQTQRRDSQEECR